ncbi:MAG: energy transducer TonB [Paludibacter sp.]|jgi:hypothetical protein|nr:energy transducer TonB [Paludibacter sp.]
MKKNVVLVLLSISLSISAQSKKMRYDNDSVKWEKNKVFTIGNVAKDSKYYLGIDSLYDFIANNVRISDYILYNKIQGEVMLRFLVDIDGNLQNIEAYKSPHDSLSVAAMEVVAKTSGKWEAAETAKGKKVKLYYELPIYFDFVRDENDVPNYVMDVSMFDIDKKKYNKIIPKFEGGLNNFYRFISSNLEYPNFDSVKTVFGNFRVSFVVNTDGSVSDLQIDMSHVTIPVKGQRVVAKNAEIEEVFKNEIFRLLLLTSGKWTAGKFDGNFVRVKYRTIFEFNYSNFSIEIPLMIPHNRVTSKTKKRIEGNTASD